MMFEEPSCTPCATVAQAARIGNLDEIKRLILEGHPCDVADNRGWRPVHEASHGDYIDCLQYLLEQGVTDANWQSFEGITPLLLACQRGNAQSVQILLDHGADPNIHDHVNTYPILTAVTANNSVIVRLLMGHGARTNVQYYCGTSPLHQAASDGLIDMVSLLLDNGAKLDIQEDYNITPIFSAALYGREECLDVLLRKAVELGEHHLVNSPADDGATPLYLASQEGHVACVRLLLKHAADANRGPEQPKALPLHAALQFNHKQCVIELLPHTDTDYLADCDRSPFYFSAIHKDPSCTVELLRAGLSPSYRHKAGDFDDEFKPRILRYFMSNIKFSNRMAPLVQVTMNRCALEHCASLLDGGACVDARTPYEVPPLLAALEYKNLDLAKLLICRGAKVNIYHPKIISNMTILITRSQWKALNLMLQCGAEAESLFSQRPVNHSTLPPAAQRYAELEDGMSTGEEEDYENEMGLLKFPIPFWRNLAESRDPSALFASTQMLRRVLYFVGCVYLEPRLEGYMESKQEWNAITAIIEGPRPLTHLCRLAIRRRMTPRQLLEQEAIKELPLPEPVIDFLLYKELEF